MSQLSNNTTALQALLEAVEALPAAGGGGECEFKTANGSTTFTPMTVNGTTYYGYAVSGLGFRPLGIVVSYSTTTASFYNPNRGTILADGDGNVVYALDYNNSGSQATAEAFAARCTITADGFTIPSSTNSNYNGQTRCWFAFGISE